MARIPRLDGFVWNQLVPGHDRTRRGLLYCCNSAAVSYTAATLLLSLVLLMSYCLSPLLLRCCQIQYKVFRKYGLDDETIRRWFNGPALLTWSRGQVAGLPITLAMPHTLTITCTCCNDEIKGIQDQDLSSCSFSDSVSMPRYTLTITLSTPLCIILVVMMRSMEFETSRSVLMLIL